MDPTTDPLYLATAPPMDPSWVRHASSTGLDKPKPRPPPLVRQPLYAAECRALTAACLSSSSSPYRHLSAAVTTRPFSVPSSVDGFPVQILELAPAAPAPGPVILYIHGGGLAVGEADSEELSCRQIAAAARARVLSVGYRLLPQTANANVCLADCLDAFAAAEAAAAAAAATEGKAAAVVVVGSSSGGQLAALVAQAVGAARCGGVVLRCPVTSDAFAGPDFVPARLRALHTSAREPSFWNELLGPMTRAVPRDGLESMPLETPVEGLRGLPRHWVQLCTNDALYSDGLCYVRLLEEAGVDVGVDVVRGWPHTFWLKAPLLPRAIQADAAMLEGLAWVCRGLHLQEGDSAAAAGGGPPRLIM